jgi:hypothetical protein
MSPGALHGFQHDHQKTQELLARFVEIQQTAGGAELMYPDVAAHLSLCETCRSLFEDLTTPLASSDDSPPLSRSVVMSYLAGGPPAHELAAQPPLDLVFRQEIILRLEHALPAVEASAERNGEPGGDVETPATGYLLFYDTLSIGKLDLVMIFTLHGGSRAGFYRIEGVISPEQPSLRLKARLAYSTGALEADVEANRLLFGEVPLDPGVSSVTVTLEGLSRWRARRQPARNSSGTRSGV